MRRSYTLIAVLTLCVTIACSTERDAKPQAPDSTRQAIPARAPRMTLERPMAMRLEGQPLLDSARVALVEGHAALAATLLEQGALFLVKQAHAPPNRGTDDLLAAARALDSVANDARHGRVIAPQRLDRLSAHANLAEAERHVALAAVAWSTRSKESVSDELTMAADHVERAASDGRIALSPAMRSALASLNAVVSDLSTQKGLDMRDLDDPLATLHLEIRAMHRQLEQQSRAE